MNAQWHEDHLMENQQVSREVSVPKLNRLCYMCHIHHIHFSAVNVIASEIERRDMAQLNTLRSHHFHVFFFWLFDDGRTVYSIKPPRVFQILYPLIISLILFARFTPFTTKDHAKGNLSVCFRSYKLRSIFTNYFVIVNE